jgi:hypothetical protein
MIIAAVTKPSCSREAVANGKHRNAAGFVAAFHQNGITGITSLWQQRKPVPTENAFRRERLFEISNIQEDETEAIQTRRGNNVTLPLNRSMEFLRAKAETAKEKLLLGKDREALGSTDAQVRSESTRDLWRSRH